NSTSAFPNQPDAASQGPRSGLIIGAKLYANGSCAAFSPEKAASSSPQAACCGIMRPLLTIPVLCHKCHNPLTGGRIRLRCPPGDGSFRGFDNLRLLSRAGARTGPALSLVQALPACSGGHALCNRRPNQINNIERELAQTASLGSGVHPQTETPKLARTPRTGGSAAPAAVPCSHALRRDHPAQDHPRRSNTRRGADPCRASDHHT